MNYKIYFIGFRLISVFFLSHSCICFAQAQVDISTSTVEKFQNFQKSRPAEKVFIHTDRDMFSPGQNLWFKAYVVEATSHKGAAPSNVLYVDLLGPDSSFYIHRVLDVQSGVAHGEMFLPVDMPAGNYVLRGHTRYMQNFPDEYMFRKEISVLDPYQKTPFTNISESAAASQGSNVRKQKPVLDVQFFAEGGHLASNMVNQLAFKALDKNGKGIPVEGAIYSVKNDSLLSFSSNALGMGKVPLFAEKGERYKARVNYNNEEFTFPLPASEDNAYILSGAIRSNVLFVQAANNFNDDMAGAFIVLHIRGHVLHVVEGKGNGHISSKLSTAGLPEGILTMTLFDRAAKPVSERLLFVENPKSGAPVEVKPGAAVYGNRQPVDIQFELAGAVDSVNLSMTIVRQDFAGSMTRENIRTYLLLSSDLQGEIELPGQYFDPANENRKDDLDVLLLTQGWRRILWEDVLSDNPMGVVIPPEEGLSIIGQIVDFYKRDEGREGTVRLGLMEDMMFEEEAVSDEQGYFIFPNLNYEDTLNF
ncbi:MAG: hypothetical protein OEX02_19570, partial [Cyclobacteriaceae bacterium]|nr:hypothetical protein [Cyclobacteriaceae bacterium]